jgi:hypothetical protein
MDTKQLQIEQVNQLIQAVEERIVALTLDLQKLDEFKDADAYHALGVANSSAHRPAAPAQ